MIADITGNIITVSDKNITSAPKNIVYVNQKSDLPTPVGGVITLLDNYTYYFTTVVDLTGDRLVCGENTTILGASSENCRIKSTGLIGTALITSNYSLPIRNITIEADVALNLDGDGINTALDWNGVNFTNCNTVGVIKDFSNFIMADGAFLNSQGLTFDGTIGTVGFTQCLFTTKTGGTSILIPATANITRRFRIIYSSFVTQTEDVSIDVHVSATIPVEGYILDTVNFSGGGIYTLGITYLSDKSLFVNCKGIDNTSAICAYYMQGNTTATDIVTQGVAVKIAGTTTPNAINQKFTHTNNRATYTGAITRNFKCTAVVSVEAAGAGKEIGLYISKNGILLTDSEIYATTTSSNKAENIAVQTITNLNQNDYVEVWIENDTDNTDITVTSLNFIIEGR